MEEQDMLNSHETIIHENILPRLDFVEREQKEAREENKAFRLELSQLKADLVGVQRGQAQLEVTVMKDGKETRSMLTRFVDHYFKQDDEEAQAEKEKLQAQVQAEKERIQAEKDLKIKKLETRQNILTAIFGTGSMAAIIGAIYQFFQ